MISTSTPTVTATSVTRSRAMPTAPVQEMLVAVSDAAATFTPLSTRPLPAAPARQQHRGRCRKKLASSILTSTLVKESLREQQREKKTEK